MPCDAARRRPSPATRSAAQTPVHLVGCLALGIIATAAGGRATVCVRGHWCEPVSPCTAVAPPPGKRTSAAFAS
ncbi:DUF3987 domain-containing protein [Streptomyces yanii]|uniref:DUF3987 domain-containing protein n=2 Tax=Streptomyces yanii TaxID=78510 RepID=A0ABV5RN81_9ACTN